MPGWSTVPFRPGGMVLNHDRVNGRSSVWDVRLPPTPKGCARERPPGHSRALPQRRCDLSTVTRRAYAPSFQLAMARAWRYRDAPGLPVPPSGGPGASRWPPEGRAFSLIGRCRPASTWGIIVIAPSGGPPTCRWARFHLCRSILRSEMRRLTTPSAYCEKSPRSDVGGMWRMGRCATPQCTGPAHGR
jgi:hypothetical protein